MAAATYTPSAPSKWIDLDGPVHYVDHGGPAGAPLIVLVHGLGGSHANWAPLAPLLTPTYRVLALDLAGFGLTAGGPRSASVHGNRDLLHRFLTELADGPAIVIGNSMGGMVTALLAAEHPELFSAVVLIDPVLPLTAATPDGRVVKTFLIFALPQPIRRRLFAQQGPSTPAQEAMDLLTLCCDDPHRIPADVIDQHVALARGRSSIPNLEADFLLAARSLVLTLVRRQWYAAQLASIPVPVMLIHGTKDRLVPFRVARVAAKANPGWRFEVATGVGHVPMLEAPKWTADRLNAWLPAALS
jgi:pimeloyl-ACP methyl ester carboxylesterase